MFTKTFLHSFRCVVFGTCSARKMRFFLLFNFLYFLLNQLYSNCPLNIFSIGNFDFIKTTLQVKWYLCWTFTLISENLYINKMFFKKILISWLVFEKIFFIVDNINIVKILYVREKMWKNLGIKSHVNTHFGPL